LQSIDDRFAGDDGREHGDGVASISDLQDLALDDARQVHAQVLPQFTHADLCRGLHVAHTTSVMAGGQATVAGSRTLVDQPAAADLAMMRGWLT